MIIKTHTEHFPSFCITEDQAPVLLVTVLCLGGSGHDCAAYEGITPPQTRLTEIGWADVLNRVRAGGRKLREEEATDLFGDFVHDGRTLAYRR